MCLHSKNFAEQKKQRTQKMETKKLHVFVIEEHTEALEVLSLAARRGLLRLGTAQMIHLDSHPDLSCFENIQPEHIHDRTELCHRLRNSEDGISSFILPSIAMGLLKDIVWVKPPWTDQIPEGVHDRLVFGWTKKGSKMAIATALPYWADDGNAVADKSELEHKTTFRLEVTPLQGWVDSVKAGANSGAPAPYTGVSGEASDTADCRGKRKRTKTVNGGIASTANPSSARDWVLDICLDYFSCANPLQEPDLPEHISSAEEITAMLEALREALEVQLRHGFCKPPALCIIARSEQDGFTPGAVAAGLEGSVLAVLQKVYGEVEVHVVESFQSFYDPQFIRRV
jgi:hypothetical protein